MSGASGFIIDKITNSIERRLSGATVPTLVVPVTAEEILTVHKKDGWGFNWKKEFKQHGRQVYKLIIENDPAIQGLVSLQSVPESRYIEMHLLESAPHNREDNREFFGVAGNLVAFVCRESFEAGFDGVIAFTAKTRLVGHYIETLGAELIYGAERMAIFRPAADNLVNSYYKNYLGDR